VKIRTRPTDDPWEHGGCRVRLIVWCPFGRPHGFAGCRNCRHQVEPDPANLKVSCEIGAGWRRWCTCDSSKNPGCPSDRCSEGRSRPATRRCSNGSTRSGSQYATAEAALNRIIRVCAGRETQGQRGNQIGRNSGHYRSPVGRRLVEPTNGQRIQRTLSLDESSASALRARRAYSGRSRKLLGRPSMWPILSRRWKPCPRPKWLTSGPQNGLQTLGTLARSGYTRPGRTEPWKLTGSNESYRRSSQRMSRLQPPDGAR
jgi:hypothetical protein